MEFTLDTIVNKVFKVVNTDGYDTNEVEDFLDEILAEMEKREKETDELKGRVQALTAELEKAKSARPAKAEAPVISDKHAAESFELVLSKAKGAYEEIVSAADKRADEIIAQANEEAANIKTNAQQEIAGLTSQLAELRNKTKTYYSAVKNLMDEQSSAMAKIKDIL